MRLVQPMAIERCGGHVTLLFSIWKESNLARSQGSRGAGFNIRDGVEATVEFLESNVPTIKGKRSAGIELDSPPGPVEDGLITVNVYAMDGQEMHDSTQLYFDLVTELRYARLLNPEDSYSIQVELELPTSQGFGMSAAGLIAVARAFHALTGRGREIMYLRIAHRIERMHDAGLGDVLGISAGGVELRVEPGAPGSGGVVESFSTVQPILLVWLPSESRHTSNYIDDPVWQRSISSAGEKAVARLRMNEWAIGRWPDLMHESRMFAQHSGLLDEEVRASFMSRTKQEILKLDLQAKVNVRLCMLGVSLAVLPRHLNTPISLDQLTAIADSLRSIGFGVRETHMV